MRMYKLNKRLPERLEQKIFSLLPFNTTAYHMDTESHVSHVTWSCIQMFGLFKYTSLNNVEEVEGG